MFNASGSPFGDNIFIDILMFIVDIVMFIASGIEKIANIFS